MIEIKEISKSFNGRQILKGVSTTFETGHVNLVIGGSGSGKTVLMKSMVGLVEIDGGEIWYDEKIFSNLERKERKPFRQEIGMVFQGGALFDSLNVEKNVMFPLNMFTKMSLEEKRERVHFCLKRVNLVNVEKLTPSELSGGMKKRVAIARAIAPSPKYLFCDEPNSGLDPQTSIVIDNLIKEITEEFNITTIVNTHDMNSVLEIGDKILYVHKGEKWWEGTIEDILKTDNKELNDFIFASKLAKNIKKTGLI
ncbi:MAG: ATP-binding cassette domain-containing protein [Bacteroidetes bacterium]|nr:ATP-binding cassette domain-containing protein [Bacteroidota bacterium]MBK9414864.1 ATP-binding cassette domain-containing protein [Bacteroidota bacterium]MBL0033457.1 ATP-binding cassette domain-containing protein [Bacteroidota bacterium]MBP6427339.1 ATP-binding cassette domain-containing protein [Bacteroidia bacterium]MBP6658395.1 ATP-binding cassette domain-containing protein [Bacteroidia bacterium]